MSGTVTVTVSYGSEKHKLEIVGQDGEVEPTLQDMAVMIEQVTGVPLTFQKLIYKGKSLKEMEKTLSALGLKNGCKVMLIGKRNSPEEDEELRKLKDFEKSVELTVTKLEEINKEFTGLQKGFLAKNLQAEALSKLDKRIKSTVEQFMKLLEQIDSVNVPDNFSDFRQKRKNLVKKVQDYPKGESFQKFQQLIHYCYSKSSHVTGEDSYAYAATCRKFGGLLAQCDTVEGNISQELDKLQSKNLALSE